MEDETTRRRRRHPFGFLKRLSIRTGELVFAVVLVGMFFLAFLVIHEVSFPEGTSLGELVRRGAGALPDAAPAVDMEGHPAVAPETFIALLAGVERSVKEKPSGKIVWSHASVGTRLGDRHAVQTFSRSGATISFDAENELHLSENSLVVIQARGRWSDRGGRSATVVVIDGELQGNVGGAPPDAIFIEVPATNSALRLDSLTRAGTEFRATANPDDSTTYTIFTGDAGVVTADERIQLAEKHTLTVHPDGRIDGPRRLPSELHPLAPVDGKLMAYRTAPPRVVFRWRPHPDALAYRVELARDPAFADLAYVGEVADTQLGHGNLKPGPYFWRVTGLVGRVEGTPGPVRKFEIRRDGEPPVLQVRFPSRSVHSALVHIAGETEPGAEVFVGDAEIETTEDGRFAHDLRLEPGVNLVVVSAIDPAGNTTYRSELVHASSELPEDGS